MSLEWSSVTVFQFLELYKQHRVLWDTKHRGHRMAEARREAWRAISESLGIDVTTIRKKYESLMATFRKLKKTAEETAAPGATNSEVYSPLYITWYAWDQMRFLLGEYDPDALFDKSTRCVQTPRHPVLQRTPKSRVPIREVPPSSPEQEYEEEYLECVDDDEVNDRHSDNDNHSDDGDFVLKVEPEPAVKRTARVPQPRRRVRRMMKRAEIGLRRRTQPARSLPAQAAVTNNNVSSSSSRQSEQETKHVLKDECNSFGEYVACSLRKHNERTQCMIKQAINNILFEQEMKKYGNTQYAVLMSESEDNPLSFEQET